MPRSQSYQAEKHLTNRAKELGAIKFGNSWLPKKRFYVLIELLGNSASERRDKRFIHFGSRGARTYLDLIRTVRTADDIADANRIRRNWYARHSKIKNKHGEYVINLPSSPAYWAARILW